MKCIHPHVTCYHAIRLAMILFFCVGLMDTAEAQHLPVSGQGENLWVLQTDDVNQGFKVLYRHASDEPGALTTARRLTGRLARQGLAGGQNQLWLVYEGNFVQSLSSTVISSSGPVIRQWSTRVEPSLPPGVRIVSMAAGKHGPWVLLEIDNAQTLDKIDAWVGQSMDQIATTRSAVTEPGKTTPNIESPAKPSAGTESSKTVTPIIETSPDPAGGMLQKVLTEPVERLVHLDRNTWKKVPLPEDWKGHAGAFVVMAGPGAESPVLVRVLRQEVEGRSSEGNQETSRVRVYRPQQPWINAQEPQWSAMDETLPGTGALQAVGIDGQVVIAQRINQAQGLGMKLYLLRQEGRSELGELGLEDVEASVAWTLVPMERSIALLTQPERERWRWTAMNLRGERTIGPTDLIEQSPHALNQIINHLVLVIVLVTATLMMFVFWKRQPIEGQIKLPKEWMIAEFSARALAGIIDLSPCIGVAFAFFSVDWFTGLDQWPGRATGMDNMLPGTLAIGLYVLHTGLSELFTGRTLGKLICGLRVVNFQGQPPHLWQVLGRNALKVLDLVAWPLLILPIISPQRQRLGDMMAKTLVVMPTPPKPPISEQDELDD